MVVVNKLLELKADVNFVPQHVAALPALHSAIEAQNLDIAAGLVQWKADVNLATYEIGMTPLMVACDIGDVTAVQFLLDQKADVDRTTHPDSLDANEEGANMCLNAVQKAAIKGHHRIVRLLKTAIEERSAETSC